MNPLTYRIEGQGKTVRVERSDSRVFTASDNSILDAFVLPRRERHNCLVWELDSAIAPILRILGREVCEMLYKQQRAYSGEYRLFYIPSKLFGVSGRKGESNLYDLAQYFPDNDAPGMLQEAHAKAEELVAALRQLKLSPTSFTSPAAIFRETIADKLDLPDVFDVPDEVGEWAYYCAGKNWIEAHQLGAWETPYLYDISASFPMMTARLLDLRHFTWEKSETWLPEARYGYCRGRVRIDAPVSPIIYQSKDEDLYSPQGEWEGWLTKTEVEFIQKWGIGSFTLEEGWFGTCNKSNYPLAATMVKLYNARELEGLASQLAKRLPVSYYGLTLQKQLDGKFGKYFCPPYAAEITTRTRLNVADFIYRHQIKPIAVNTDSVLCLELVELSPNNGMGRWRLVSQEPALVIASGMQYQGQKHPQGWYYDRLVREIKKAPWDSEYECYFKRRVTLGQAMSLGFEYLGEERQMINSVDILQERDRDFGKGPQTGGDLMGRVWGSTPWDVSDLER